MSASDGYEVFNGATYPAGTMAAREAQRADMLASGRIPDGLLDYLASAPIPQSIHTQGAEVEWQTLWLAREQNILLARELQQARTSLRLIAASLPYEYNPPGPEADHFDLQEEEPMVLSITPLHDEVLERLLDSPTGSVKVGLTTSPGIIRACHELVQYRVIDRDLADTDRYRLPTD